MNKTQEIIKNLLKDANILGTGFIPSNKNEWWFAVGNKKFWKKNQKENYEISFTAIGGHVEENESFLQATKREVKEETGVNAIIHDSNETLWIEAELFTEEIHNFHVISIKKVDFSTDLRPWIIYKLKRKDDILGVVVFKGSFQDEPFPSNEVPALLLLPTHLLLDSPKTLEELIELGAKIREQNETIPRNAIFYSFGSVTILQYLMKSKNII